MTDLHFDSGFERGLYAVIDPEVVEYHPDVRLQYVIEKKYEPDWYVEEGEIEYFIEAKGRFRDSEEARKYVEIKKSLSDSQRLVFILQRPEGKMPNAKRRKDGTTFCMAEWCDRHGFEWYTAHSLPDRWRRKL